MHPGDVVSHALDVMLSAGQGRLPVTDPESGALVGLLTRKDLLQVRATTVRAEAERRAYFRRGRARAGTAEADGSRPSLSAGRSAPPTSPDGRPAEWPPPAWRRAGR